MATSNLLERVMKLGEILAAVDYEFRQLVPPQAITDPYIARLLPDLWECAGSYVQCRRGNGRSGGDAGQLERDHDRDAERGERELGKIGCSEHGGLTTPLETIVAG